MRLCTKDENIIALEIGIKILTLSCQVHEHDNCLRSRCIKLSGDMRVQACEALHCAALRLAWLLIPVYA